MDPKTLLVVFSMLYFDASNALMCYNCTGSDLGCGETLSDPSSIQKVTCSGICMVAKSTVPLGEQTFTIFSRTCEIGCSAGCYNFGDVSACSNCCNTDLCNNAFTDPSTGGNEENPPLPVDDTDSPQGGDGGDSNALMCYNCTDMTNPGCGETLSNPSTTPQVACSGTCMVAKTSVAFGENTFTSFTRTCEMPCVPGCRDIQGTTLCITCCNTDRCNGAFTDPSPGGDGGVSNPVVCYQCEQSTNPGCGETLSDPSTSLQAVCTAAEQCMVSKYTVSGNQFFTRGCATTCIPGCIDVGVDGSTMCSKCCNTDLCNSALTDGVEGGVIPTEGGAVIPASGDAVSPDSHAVTPQYGDGGSSPTGDRSKPPGGDEIKPSGGDGESNPQDNDVGGAPDDAPAGNKGNPVASDGMKYTTPIPSSAINIVVNFATILFTYLLSTTML